MRISTLAVVCVLAAATACSGKALDAIASQLESLEVTISSGAVRVGGSAQLSVVAKDQSGNVVNGQSVSWLSADTTVATVSTSGTVRGRKVGQTSVSATAKGKSAAVQVSVTAVPLTSITVSLTRSTVPVGQTATASASLKDSAGATVTGKPVAWSSSNTSVAAVDGGGVVSAQAPGTSTISAAADGVTGSSAMTVIVAPVASVAVNPGSASLITGGTFQLAASTFDAGGQPLTGRVVTWSSSNAAVASVSASGMVTAAGVGSATITATSEGINGTASVTVAAPPPIPVASVSVALNASSLTVGQSTQATATTRDGAGNVLTGRGITWSSSNVAVATVSGTGVVQAVGAGTASIRATSEGITGSATVTVTTVPVATVTVSLASSSITAGTTTQATAVTKDASGNVLTGRVVTWATSASGVATVNASGVVTAVAPGTASIRATSEGITGSATVTATQTPVATVTVSLASSSLTVGQMTQATATTKDASGNTLTGRAITWGTSNTGIATVDANGTVTAAGAGTVSISATSEGQAGAATLTVTVVPVATVSASLASSSITVGATTQATAVTKDAGGNVLTGRTVTWSSSNPAAATVNPSGLVTAISAGVASITATSEGQSGAATVTVTVVPVATVAVTLGSSGLTVGQTTQATATTRDASGNVLTGRTVTWSSSNATVATVSATGLVTAIASGTASITATSEGVTGSATVTVTAVPVATVTVSLASSSIMTGTTTQATAVTKDASGNVLTGRVITWASSATGIATVNASGVVTGVAAGTATITATSEGKSGSATVTVTVVPVASVAVTLGSSGLTVGQTTQATAVTKDAAGNVLTGRTVTWSSSNTTVATVSASGLVTAIASGTASITATSEGVTGSATVTVTVVPVATVAVTLGSSGLTVGQTAQATAVTKDASGNVLTGRTVTWSSANTAVATVNATGLVTAISAGAASITATSEGQSGAATVTVTVVPVATVAVTLGSSGLTVGQTTQGTAVTKDASGNVLTGRTVTWSSANTAVATVNASGLVTAVGVGTASITATSEGVTGLATVTVTAVPVATVTVSLASSSIMTGTTTQATAVTKDASGNVLTGRVITWATSASGIATVNASGVVTGVAAGTATITATSEGKSGAATVTVTAAAPAPVATVTLAPTSLNLPAGATGQLTPTLKDAAGNTLTGRVVTWATSASGVATVSASGLVTAVAVGSATITATSEGKSATAPVTVTPAVSPGVGVPVYDPTNSTHVLHVFEDWSAYTSTSQVGVINRADGGGPWLNGNSAFQSFSTNNNDPWFGKKSLDINYQAAPAANQSFENGLTLIQGSPARYLNAGSVQASIVIEWAWRWEGGPYEGKIADFQPYAGTDRFNYQTDPDQMGSQTASSCDADALCSKYYTNNGNTPRFAGLTPQADYGTGAFARGINASGVMFYRQNRNWGTGTGQVDWGGNSWATMGIKLADNTWRRTILRLTLNAGAMGTGRVEEWMQKAGEPAVKMMEYIGDAGGFDAGLVNGRDTSQGGNTWISSSATLYLYNLSAVGGIFVGGNTTHLGYVRIWSEPRQ